MGSSASKFKRYLVTGGAGFIGSNLVAAWPSAATT